MAYYYKTVLRAENKMFDICQNKHNSIKATILMFPKTGHTDMQCIGEIDNKKGNITIYEKYIPILQPSTIEKLKSRLNNWVRPPFWNGI